MVLQAGGNGIVPNNRLTSIPRAPMGYGSHNRLKADGTLAAPPALLGFHNVSSSHHCRQTGRRRRAVSIERSGYRYHTVSGDPGCPTLGARYLTPPSFEAIDLGPLPVQAINAVLGTELEPGHARLSRAAHRHMATDHSDDYPICREALRGALENPTFIGQDPSHAGNFVLVKRVGLVDGRVVLVAVGLEPAGGTYAVRTSYLISQRTVDARRSCGRLKAPPSR